MNEPQKFSERLKAWREERCGLTQPEAAHVLNIGRSYYSQLEGGRPPGKFLAEKFAQVEHLPVHKVRALAVSKVNDPHTDEHETPRAEDSGGELYGNNIHALMRKVIDIEERGTPEQIAMLDDVINGIYERLLRPAHHVAETPPDAPEERRSRRKDREEKTKTPATEKKIGFQARDRRAALLRAVHAKLTGVGGGAVPAFAS